MMLRRYETGSELRLGRERETWRSSAKILDGMKERKKKRAGGTSGWRRTSQHTTAAVFRALPCTSLKKHSSTQGAGEVRGAKILDVVERKT